MEPCGDDRLSGFRKAVVVDVVVSSRGHFLTEPAALETALPGSWSLDPRHRPGNSPTAGRQTNLLLRIVGNTVGETVRKSRSRLIRG